MLDTLQARIPEIAARAAALDESGAFPSDDMALLRDLGLAMLPLPRALGGEGAGTEPAGATTILDTLRLLGTANLSVGRLFEAHVNVIRLITRYGTTDQRRHAATICRSGNFIGLWVTDAHNHPVTRTGTTLAGAKGPSSGAGHLPHALITVTTPAGVRMALITLDGTEKIAPLGPRLHGMRASANGVIHLDGLSLPDSAIIGQPGDYLREPDLSTGAWRTMAVTLGGMETVLALVKQHLLARHHEELPLQQARFGEMLIALETARLWTSQAATIAETGTQPAPDQVAYVNLARIAVESACFDLLRHAQRALGLAAFVRPHPLERLMRDLATYLRQPAPDLVLTEAAAHALTP